MGIWKIMDEAHVTNLSVHPDYQNKKLAHRLLLASIDECYKEKIYDIDSIKKSKKIGNIKVKASEYIITLQHNELSNAMVEYLKNNDYKNIKVEENYVDIKCVDKDGKKIFYELKTARTVKSSIREALGQLLEYSHYPNVKKADKLIIVTKEKPEETDAQYLQVLRTAYNIPIYYQYFDMKTNGLSEEY